MKKATKGITEWHLAELGWLTFSSTKQHNVLDTDERKYQIRRKLELEIVLQKFVKLKGGKFHAFFEKFESP